MARVVIGTAGHIDHGKSSLVRALTGTDPDRLPEEKRRQITIDLGYAFLDDVAAIIDVPGHEKFIHNMVAGATTVDFALLVIAADDGIMPQTREHLHILRLLGLQRGAIVLTKCAMVAPEWLDLVVEQVQSEVRGTFLEAARVFRVDSLAGSGIPELRAYLLAELDEITPRNPHRVLRIPIDRVFTIHGYGTVVTGTVIAGKIEKDMRVDLLPGAITARVKHLQSNARDQSTICAGTRAAVNLAADRSPIRGQTLALPDSLVCTKRLVVKFESVPGASAPRDRQRIRVLTGTQEVIGRLRVLVPDAVSPIALLLLDEEVVAACGDRCILRRYSPVETLGGGVVLDVTPVLRGARDKTGQLAALRELAAADSETAPLIWATAHSVFGLRIDTVARAFAITTSHAALLFQSRPNDWLTHSGWVAHRKHLLRWEAALLERLKTLHREQKDVQSFSVQQLSAALPAVPVELISVALTELVAARKVVLSSASYYLPGANTALDPKLERLMEQVVNALAAAGFAPPSAALISEQFKIPRAEVERAMIAALRANRVVRLGIDLFFEARAFAHAVTVIKNRIERDGSVQVSDVSKELESSRKYVVPMLEYLDSKGVTERRDNSRVKGRNFSGDVS